MPSRRFVFNTRPWLVQSVVMDIRGNTEARAHASHASERSGTLIVEADSQEALDAAIEKILRNPLYDGHFRPA